MYKHQSPDPINTPRSSKKTVSFSKSVRVVLIPQRKEFIQAGLHTMLWQTEQDFLSFRKSTDEETLELMKKCKAAGHPITTKEAQKQLYQPNVICKPAFITASRKGLLMFESDQTRSEVETVDDSLVKAPSPC